MRPRELMVSVLCTISLTRSGVWCTAGSCCENATPAAVPFGLMEETGV